MVEGEPRHIIEEAASMLAEAVRRAAASVSARSA
jgi:hypothetical protein